MSAGDVDSDIDTACAHCILLLVDSSSTAHATVRVDTSRAGGTKLQNGFEDPAEGLSLTPAVAPGMAIPGAAFPDTCQENGRTVAEESTNKPGPVAPEIKTESHTKRVSAT